jgi:hypothetical protein
MHGCFEAPALIRSFCSFARLVCDGAYPKLLAAEFEHLRHERHPLEAAVIRQRGKYFLFGPNFYKIARAKTG